MKPKEVPDVPFLARVWVDNAAMGCGWRGVLVYAREGVGFRILELANLYHAKIASLVMTNCLEVSDDPQRLKDARRRLRRRIRDFETMGPAYLAMTRSRSVTKAMRILDAAVKDR